MPSFRNTLAQRLSAGVVSIALGASLVSLTAAPAAAVSNGTPATATTISALPFASAYSHPDATALPAASDAANKALATACNGGSPIYAPRWFKYTASTAVKLYAEGEVNSIFGRDSRAYGGLVAVLSTSQAVLDCSSTAGMAAAGPLTLAAGTTVYIVQAESVPGYCSEPEFCNTNFTQGLVVKTVGDSPSNDDWQNALPITSVGYNKTVDNTLATKQPVDETAAVSCGATNVELARTLWWTFTPATTGPLDIRVNYEAYVTRAAYAKLTANGPEFLPQSCEQRGTKPAQFVAGTTYLVMVGTPVDAYAEYDEPGAGAPLTLTVANSGSLAKPDLVVTSLAVSRSAPKAGDPLSFRATVKNQGGAPTPGGVILGVLFRVDGTPRTWSDTFDGTLAPGQSVTLTANGGSAGVATWPATPGGHTVQAVVDDINRIAGEANESNNTRNLALSVAAGPARPDLVVASVGITPANPAVGALVKFTATVKNIGTAATPAGTIVGVLFTVDGANIAWSDNHTAAVAPGASVTLTSNGGPGTNTTGVWKALAGAHVVGAQADDINRIPESDENNNSRTNPITVGTLPTRPDLVITGVSYRPTSPTAGSPVRFSATVKNVGTRATPAGTLLRVAFWINNDSSRATYSDIYTEEVQPGDTVTLIANGGGTSGTWTPPTSGSYALRVIVDTPPRILELNEGNNEVITTITSG